MAEYLGAIFIEQQHVVGVFAVAHFHAGGACGHAGNGEAFAFGAFFQQAVHVAGGDMAFNGVAVDKGRMAGPGAGQDAGFFLDGLQVLLLVDCLLYTSPSPRDPTSSRMPSSA